MLFPKKVKYRKWQKFRVNLGDISPASRGTSLSYGAYGMKAETAGRLKSNHIEAARRVISRTLGKTGKTWIRVFPDRPITKKAAEVPMGKGKGDLQGYMVEVRPGRMIFEVDGVSEEVAREAFRKAGTKLPMKTRFAARKTHTGRTE